MAEPVNAVAYLGPGPLQWNELKAQVFPDTARLSRKEIRLAVKRLSKREQAIFKSLTDYVEHSSQPHKFRADDGNVYLVKFANNQDRGEWGVFCEQIVATAGTLIGAPVVPVRLVNVSAELLAGLNITLGGNPFAEFKRLTGDHTPSHLSEETYAPRPGIHHGSRWLGDGWEVVHCRPIRASVRPEVRMMLPDGQPDYPPLKSEGNRPRFGALEVLYTWTGANDWQFLYKPAAPYEVYSFDHTRFLGERDKLGRWETEQTIERDRVLSSPRLGLSDDDRAGALKRLKDDVTEDRIAAVVKDCSPAEWGISEYERDKVARVLAIRRAEVVELFSSAT